LNQKVLTEAVVVEVSGEDDDISDIVSVSGDSTEGGFNKTRGWRQTP